MSSSSAVVYQAVITADSCGCAVITLLFYDWALSLSNEVELFWRTPKTCASMLYLFNRYLFMCDWVLGIVTIPPVSDTSCTVLYWSSVVTNLLASLGPSLFSCLRVYALTGQNKFMAGLTLALGTVPFLINVGAAYQSSPVNMPPPINCTLDSTTSPMLALALTCSSRSALMLSELIVVGVTWRTTRESRKLVSGIIVGPSLADIMFYSGNVYFVLMACVNVLHMVLTALSFKYPSGSESYVIDFIDPIASLLVCHFLISLQEANRWSTRGGAVSSFVLPPLGDSNVTPFVASLGGPVHRPGFRDDHLDEDLPADVDRTEHGE